MWALAATIGLLGPARAAPPWVDPGSPDSGSGPLAVIVPQPGLRPMAYTELARTLEANGWSTVLMRLPTDPSTLTTRTLPAVSRATADRPVLLVGHGYGGRAALGWSDLTSATCAVALLGVPLVVRTTAWPTPLPQPGAHPDGLQLAHDPHTFWPLVQPGAHIPTSWLGHLSADWLAHIAEAPAHPVTVPAHHPGWVAVAPLDELAPPETTGVLPSTTTFTRWGMLRGWRTDATTADLLTDTRPAAHLARWAHRSCA